MRTRKIYIMTQTCNSLLRIMLVLLLILGVVSLAASRAEAYVLTPQTWNIVGLDSNEPTNTSLPNLFPVGAKVCGGTIGTSVDVYFSWLSSNSYINLRPGSNGDGGTPLNITFRAGNGGCADAFFEAEITRDAAAFETSREYKIYIGSDSTPIPRALYVEKLISQGRNGIGTVSVDGVIVPAGGSMNLIVNNIYTIALTDWTATQGYNQLESFLTLSNTYFQILSVSSSYSADSSPYVPDPVYGNGLYADACKWDNDPGSPTYRNCIGGDYKVGGNPVVTTYLVKIISGGGSRLTLNSQVTDFSGASYHYNSDYATSARFANIIDPASTNIAKTFSPDTTTVGGVSTLTFTLTNPNAGAVSGLEFTDVFPVTPGAMILYDTVTTNTCGGTLTNSGGTALTAGNPGIKLSAGTVAANSSCIVQVNVTTDAAGTYTNTSQNLLVNSLNTGKSATATLTVSSAPSPPTPPSTCTTPVTLATWTMPASGQGSGGPPPPYTTKAADVSTATASYATVSGVQSISTAIGNPVNAWGGTAPTGADGWNETPTSMANYFQFVLDTSKYGGVTISLDGRPDGAGDWANPYSNGYINTSSGGGYTVYNSGVTPFYPQFGKNAWTTISNIPAAATGTSTTTFRIGVDGSGTRKTAATFYLDNVIFKGCPIPLPPTMTKSFATSTVGVGGTSTLTFTITNPNTCCQLTGIAFTDSLPQNSLQGTVSVTNGSPTVTGVGTAFTTQLVPGSIIYINKVAYTLSASAITSDTSLDLNANYAGATAGGLTITSGLTLSGTPTTTCTGGSVTTTTDATTGAPVINLASGSIVAGAGTTCTVTATVKDSIAGPISNVSGPVTSTSSGAIVSVNGVARATLTAILPPKISKLFSPNPILSGGTSTLTFLVTNPNQADDLTGVAFSDGVSPIFPATMLVATPMTPGITYSTSGCGTPTFTPVAGAGSFTFSNGTITKGSTCTVNVNMTATAAGTNTSGAVSATTAGTGNTATDTLNIVPARPEVSMFKEIASSNTAATVWSNYLALPTGGNVYYQFQVQNDGNVPLSSVSVTDNQVNMASCAWQDGDGLPLTSPFTLAVGNAVNNKDFATCVLGPFVAVAGSHSNTATANSSYSGSPYTDTDTAIYATTGLTLAKSVTQSYYTAAGNVLNYSYLVTNSGSATLNGPVTVADNKATVTCPALSTIGNLNNYLEAGESITCTASHTVTAAEVTAGSITNTATASTPAGGNIGGATSNTDSKTVINPVRVTKSFSPAAIRTSDLSTLTITLANTTSVAATLSSDLTDTLPAGVTVAGAVGGTCTGTKTAVLNGNTVIYASGGGIPTTGSCTITVPVTSSTTLGALVNTIPVGALQTNQGSNPVAATATLTVTGKIVVVKSFSPAMTSVNGTTDLILDFTDTTGVAHTNIAFRDNLLPAGTAMSVASPLVTSNACGGTLWGDTNATVALVAGHTFIRLTGGTLAASATCRITVKVKVSATPGTYSNQAYDITYLGGLPLYTSNTATLLATALPTVAKVFSPTPINPGDISTLTITLGNSNAIAGTLSSTFTDTLPSGVTVAPVPNKGGTCTQASITANAGTGIITYASGASIPAGGCTIIADVTSSTSGTATNSIAPGALVADIGSNIGTTTANLVVNAPLEVTKTSNVPTAAPGTNIIYTIGYRNPNSSTWFQDIVISDPVPMYTTYVSASCGTPPAGISCSMTNPAVGATGTVIWTMVGNLNAGVSGSVTLTVKVD